MNILAFDTCWKACSVALVSFHGDEPKVLAHRFEEMATGQAEILPVMLAEVFQDSGIMSKDIHRIAVTHGPGSFTGVRIGIAAARALKLSTEADLVSCSSLQALALTVARAVDLKAIINIDQDNALLVAMDARRDEVYAHVFNVTSDGQIDLAPTDPHLLPVSQAASLSQANNLIFAGTAAEAVAEGAKKTGRQIGIFTNPCVPDALDLAFNAKSLIPLSEPLMPLYLRPPDAKPSSKPAIQRTSP